MDQNNNSYPQLHADGRKCPACGKPIQNADAAFCAFCGTKLEGSAVNEMPDHNSFSIVYGAPPPGGFRPQPSVKKGLFRRWKKKR